MIENLIFKLQNNFKTVCYHETFPCIYFTAYDYLNIENIFQDMQFLYLNVLL